MIVTREPARVLDGLWQELAAGVRSTMQDYRSRLANLQVHHKADRTLLTEADLAVQQLITGLIRELDPAAVIIAEEDDRSAPRTEVLASPESVWVIDPIDGTAEFVRPDGVEFCSVICLLRRLEPVAALIVAPELGRARHPLVMTADRVGGTITVNGEPVAPGGAATPPLASVTRSRGATPRPFETALQSAGYSLKTRTTSQSIDMVRTAVDLRPFADEGLAPFRLFHRARQRVWDGVAGLCLGEIAGCISVDQHGRPRLPVPLEILGAPEPTFDTTVMGSPDDVEWFVRSWADG